jgi:hypothetical protein
MCNVTEEVTEQSVQLCRMILRSICGLSLVSIFFVIGANGILADGTGSPEAQSPQVTTGQTQEFYISISTDERDQPGLSTLIVAGPNRLMFDCGVAGSAPVATTPSGVTALFFTNLNTPTADGINRARGDASTGPSLRVWGPPGTREWILQAVGVRALGDRERRSVTVIDLRESMVRESGNVTIAAIETAPSRFAYRLGFEGRSVLIASDVTYSEHLVTRSEGVDIVVLRHSDTTEATRFLERIRPRLAVLSQDGIPASVAQIREHYVGALELLGPGTHRIDVRARLAVNHGLRHGNGEPQPN